MEGLLSFILFAVVFYLVMRFGCGAHMIHGDQHMQKASVDPVCGMEVEPNEGYGKYYSGHMYRFCTRSCLDKFDHDPQRYLNGGADHA